MKKQAILVLTLVLCAGCALAQTLPDLGRYNVKVVGQNLENYLVGHLNHSNADAQTVSELQAKTDNIVRAFRTMDADIYAMVELEQADTALIYLTNAMNRAAGSEVYAYVQDNISDCWQNSTGYGSIMAGFIYKKATIETVGRPQAMASDGTYGPRMQAQVFKHTASGEMFVLSMNHFKAMSGESNVQKRLENAQSLISNLSQMTATDPDVLIMGDLNCVTSEAAIQYLIGQGYTELTEYFDRNAWSYYYGGNELIDHALGNISMSMQVSGAGVYHVNHTGNSSYHYSDHDAVMVGLNLGGTGNVDPGDLTPDDPVIPDNPNDPDTPQGNDCFNQLYDFTTAGIGPFMAVSLRDDYTVWAMNRSSKYGIQVDATRANSDQDDWLISPELDLEGLTAATISLNHCVYKGSADNRYMKLLATAQYTGDPETTVWTEIPIQQFGTGSTYRESEQAVPQELLTRGFRFALHYSTYGDQWEIKQAEVKGYCDDHSALEQVETQPAAEKVLIDGQIYILRDGAVYSLTGNRIR